MFKDVKNENDELQASNEELKINVASLYNIKSENDRHSLLIKSQTVLQVMQIFNHFDSNHNLILELDELKNNNINVNSIISLIK